MIQAKSYQVLTGDRENPVLQNWFTNRKGAEEQMSDCLRFWPDEEWWIEEGTEYIKEKCRECDTVHCNERFDAYGNTTGFWCDPCYDSPSYPYRKDNYYDYLNAGEYLEPEDY